MTQGELICTRCGQRGHVAAACRKGTKGGMRPGTDLGGVDSLDDLRGRCVIGEEPGPYDEPCWHFRSARGRKAAKGRTMVVHSRIHGQGVSARMLSMHLFTGEPLPSGWVTMSTCGKSDCVNPRHLKAGPRGQITSELQAKTDSRRNAAVLIGNIRAGALRSRVPPEVWGWVYESTQSATQLAHVLGVAHSHINAKRAKARERGMAWLWR